MNCQACQIELPDYVDGSVTPEVRHAVESHLRTCHACAQALGEERQALTHFAATLAPAAQARQLSPAARARMAAAGRAGARLTLPWWHAWRNQLTAAAALLLAVGISGLCASSLVRTPSMSAHDAPPAALCNMAQLTNTLSLLVQTACISNVSDTLAVNTVYRARW